VELHLVAIEKPESVNVIIGQAHFIKTVEDIHEAVVATAPQMQFGLAFCEASGPALVRWSGNNEGLVDLARRNALALGAGHCFVLFIDQGFPVSILNTIKGVPEVCRVFCATANAVQVVLAESAQGRGILGVIDGVRATSIESEADIGARKDFLRRIGYKL
jgi:adenosine/AMP kinase